MKKVLLLCLALVVQTLKVGAVEYIDWVDWDQIQHWAGDPNGEKKCALVIDFQDFEGMESLVWGYRWNGTKTGEDLMRAVASQSSILTAMIQYTGNMGSTLNALGVSPNRDELNYLHYDFDRAAIGGEVSFGYFDPNISMGQENAPGYEAEQMCIDAINRAKETGIIEHPLNAFFYGYPAYDYDYWQLEEGVESPDYRWRSGWYDGYWSYWHGPNDYDYMGYSGLGMSSTVLTDGCVQAWKYIIFNGDGIGYMGGELAEALNYDMADWGEEMHEAAEAVQPVDQSDVTFWVGSGEKAATVIFQFNDGRGPENLVYGYRWSGGWDDDLLTVITKIANADPRMSFSRSGSQLMLTYDSDHDGMITSAYDHVDVSETWNCYVKRTIDADFNKVNSGRWLNPNAVMIFSHQPKETASVELPYLLFRPALDSEQILTVPSYIDYALADKNLELPVFIQLPEGGKINTAFTWIKSNFSMLSATNVQNLMGHVTAYSNFAPTEGSVQIRGSYTAPGTTKAEYVFSNNAKIALRNPVRPITSMSYEQPEVDARLSHTVDNTLVIEPADATYTKMTYKSSNTRAATVNSSTGVVTTTKTAGEADITATYAFNSDLTASFSLQSELKVPVEDITFEAVGEDGVLTLTPKEMTGLFPILTPADPDIADVTVTLSDNGSAASNYIATMYKVNLWDENNNRMTPYELSGHREGECTLTVEATDGSGFKKEIPVRVVEPERESVIDYTTGTIMLNEEWFGHTNGGLNWFAPDYSVTYQAYERENPGMSFGCTSQYGLIYNDKLIVSSKQAADGGDPLPGGGRLVVADAATLQRLGSIDEIKLEDEARSADGRALCGAGPGRVYMGTNNGIYVIDIETFEILGKVSQELIDDEDDGKPNTDPSGSLYSGQIGDMVLAGNHVFAIKQDAGVYIVDIDSDVIVKSIADKYVQGITQGADGRVWYATKEDGHSVFVAIDHETLEESERVDVPAECGVVTCGWGAWRTTQFTGAHSVNSLFFSGGSSIANGGDGDYWRYDVDSKEFRHIATVAGLPAHTPGLKQGAYGTVRYDDRTGEIIAGTTESKASGHYRYNWTHFIDAETGEFMHTVELRPYYWFQSMPIFPDAHGPEVEAIDDVKLNLDDEPVEITINATDRDNNDANIRYSLISDPRMMANEAGQQPVEVALEGNKLTLTPKAVGNHTVRLAIESNGKVINHTVGIEVNEVTGVNSVEDLVRRISSDGRTITVIGYNGMSFDIVDVQGMVVDSFTADSDQFIHTVTLAPGIYILVSEDCVSKKIIIK